MNNYIPQDKNMIDQLAALDIGSLDRQWIYGVAARLQSAVRQLRDEATASKFTSPGPITGVWIDEATEPSKEGE